jgi:hypothetical protein
MERAQTQADNQANPARRSARGSDACVVGYVWRDAGPLDHVCVTPQIRDQTSRQNQLSASRVARDRSAASSASLASVGASSVQQRNPPSNVVVPRLSNLPAPMPIPSHLGSTTDPPTCSRHGGLGGGLACDALLSQGQLALIWAFRSNQNPVTGFHIYRVDGGGSTLVGAQPDGPAVTVALLPMLQGGGVEGACYSVAAYNGAGEGKPSAPFCPSAQSVACQMTAPSTGMSMTLCPQAMMTWSPPAPGLPSTLTVGGSVTQWMSAGLLVFDVPQSDVNRRQLVSATLKMRVVRTDLGTDQTAPNYHRDTSTSCAAYIFENTNVWWPPPYTTAPAPASGPFDEAIGEASPDPKDIQQQGPNVAFDVTDIARDWFSYNVFNFGFSLYGVSNDYHKASNLPYGGPYCSTTYDPNSVVLVLQFA